MSREQFWFFFPCRVRNSCHRLKPVPTDTWCWRADEIAVQREEQM